MSNDLYMEVVRGFLAESYTHEDGTYTLSYCRWLQHFMGWHGRWLPASPKVLENKLWDYIQASGFNQLPLAWNFKKLMKTLAQEVGHNLPREDWPVPGAKVRTAEPDIVSTQEAGPEAKGWEVSGPPARGHRAVRGRERASGVARRAEVA